MDNKRTVTINTRDLLVLAEQITERGNRLEVMNGKIYEVSRKLIGEIKKENK